MAVILIECFNFLKDLVRTMNAKRCASFLRPCWNFRQSATDGKFYFILR